MEREIKKDLFTWPSEAPHLIGCRCKLCGETYFPKRRNCVNCNKEEMEDTLLSRRGKLYTYTVVRYPPPDFRGTAPYGVGIIELPEGIRINSVLTKHENLKIDMEMELVIETLYEDEKGDKIMTYKFQPILEEE